MSAETLRRDLDRYSAAHSMSRDVAAGMQVAALLGWLEAEDKRQERERLNPAIQRTEAELSQPPVTVLRDRPPRDQKQERNGMYEILRQIGEPMHAKELLAALRERGVPVSGKDPQNNIRAHLSHDARFVSVGNGRWDLASRARRSG